MNTPKKPLSKRKATPKRRRNKKNGKYTNKLWTILLIIMVFFIITDIIGTFSDTTETIAISEVASLVNSGEVEMITVEGESLELMLTAEDGTEAIVKSSKKEAGTALSETLVNYGVTPEALSAINIKVAEPSGALYWLGQILPFLFPVIIILLIIWFFSRQMKGSNMKALSFGNSQARMIDPNNKDKRVTFADVAGNEVAKQELVEMVEFLKNPKRFIDMGAKIILCDPHRATVIGIDKEYPLRGISMSSPDIRAGVSLLIAALSAEGKSQISNISQIDRGYQNIDTRLKNIGADITRL